ncbi:MAG TPA: SDR family oxidoreductase, partial [Acetobacteraceae bacterium]|nr:SDR family oxidoreductase [Acetobacteraceae bacterium]
MTDVATEQGMAAAAGLGPNAFFQRLDASSEADWQTAIAFTGAEFGPLHVLVNNAFRGIGLQTLTATLEAFQSQFTVTTNGVFLGMKHAAPAMTEGGAIIN